MTTIGNPMIVGTMYAGADKRLADLDAMTPGDHLAEAQRLEAHAIDCRDRNVATDLRQAALVHLGLAQTKTALITAVYPHHTRPENVLGFKRPAGPTDHL